MDERLRGVEGRIAVVENDLAKIKLDIHATKNEMQVATAEAEKMKKSLTAVANELAEVRQNTNDILGWVSGANTVFGFAKKHWRTALTFGCGIMTAAGIGNPTILNFISNLFRQ
jgi:hypothetical protein